jgi:hypothetical protein
MSKKYYATIGQRLWKLQPNGPILFTGTVTAILKGGMTKLDSTMTIRDN